MTLQLSRHLRLTVVQNDSNSDANALSFLNFALGEEWVPREQEDIVTLLPSISLESDVGFLYRDNFNSIKTNYTLHDWPTRLSISSTKNADLEGLIAVVEAYIPREMKTIKNSDNGEN